MSPRSKGTDKCEGIPREITGKGDALLKTSITASVCEATPGTPAFFLEASIGNVNSVNRMSSHRNVNIGGEQKALIITRKDVTMLLCCPKKLFYIIL